MQFYNEAYTRMYEAHNTARAPLPEFTSLFLENTIITQVDENTRSLLNLHEFTNANLQSSHNTKLSSQTETQAKKRLHLNAKLPSNSNFAVHPPQKINSNDIIYFKNNAQNLHMSLSQLLQQAVLYRAGLKFNKFVIYSYKESPFSETQFQIKIFCFADEKAESAPAFLILLEDVKHYYSYIQSKITLKIMKRLFKTMSHEYSTQLNQIYTMVQAAILDPMISEPVKQEYFHPIEKSIRILESIVNDIRDFNLM